MPASAIGNIRILRTLGKNDASPFRMKPTRLIGILAGVVLLYMLSFGPVHAYYMFITPHYTERLPNTGIPREWMIAKLYLPLDWLMGESLVLQKVMFWQVTLWRKVLI
jgi:hypothetical protein